MGRLAKMPDSGTEVTSRLRRTSSVVLASLAVLGFTAPDSPAQTPANRTPPITWVFPKHANYELRDPSGNVIPAATQFVLFQVENKEGPRLWIRSGWLRGWINADEVVSADSAVEFFTREIKNDPDDILTRSTLRPTTAVHGCWLPVRMPGIATARRRWNRPIGRVS